MNDLNVNAPLVPSQKASRLVPSAGAGAMSSRSQPKPSLEARSLNCVTAQLRPSFSQGSARLLTRATMPHDDPMDARTFASARDSQVA